MRAEHARYASRTAFPIYAHNFLRYQTFLLDFRLGHAMLLGEAGEGSACSSDAVIAGRTARRIPIGLWWSPIGRRGVGGKGGRVSGRAEAEREDRLGPVGPEALGQGQASAAAVRSAALRRSGGRRGAGAGASEGDRAGHGEEVRSYPAGLGDGPGDGEREEPEVSAGSRGPVPRGHAAVDAAEVRGASDPEEAGRRCKRVSK